LFFRHAAGTATGPQRLSRAFKVNESLKKWWPRDCASVFGDSVTESTWSDLWLSEGFATYFAGLVIDKYDGEESFRLT